MQKQLLRSNIIIYTIADFLKMEINVHNNYAVLEFKKIIERERSII